MATIEEDYCSYEVAKLLKEKGFNVAIHTFYNPNKSCTLIKFDSCLINRNAGVQISAPTLQMAMKWLRKIHHYIIMIDYDSYEKADDEGVITGYSFTVQKKENPTKYEYIHNWAYNTYEEAVDAAIHWSLENLIELNNENCSKETHKQNS